MWRAPHPSIVADRKRIEQCEPALPYERGKHRHQMGAYATGRMNLGQVEYLVSFSTVLKTRIKQADACAAHLSRPRHGANRPNRSKG